MEYGRIEKYKDIYRIVSISTSFELLGTCIRNNDFDYAVYPFTYNSFIMTNDALNDGYNVILDADAMLSVQSSGAISPTVITIEVIDDETQNAVNKSRNALLRERGDIMGDVTLPNVYRYLNNFYDMFESGVDFNKSELPKDILSDKCKIDTILNRIDEIDVKLKELNNE